MELRSFLSTSKVPRAISPLSKIQLETSRQAKRAGTEQKVSLKSFPKTTPKDERLFPVSRESEVFPSVAIQADDLEGNTFYFLVSGFIIILLLHLVFNTWS